MRSGSQLTARRKRETHAASPAAAAAPRLSAEEQEARQGEVASRLAQINERLKELGR